MLDILIDLSFGLQLLFDGCLVFILFLINLLLP